MHYFVGVCNGWVGDALVLKLYGVGEAFVLGVADVAIVSAMVPSVN
jgi:hypothetical protein